MWQFLLECMTNRTSSRHIFYRYICTYALCITYGQNVLSLFVVAKECKHPLAVEIILGCCFFPFSILNGSCCSFLVSKFLQKNQLIALWGFPCVLFAASPLLLLIYNFCHFDYNVSWCVPFWVNSMWDSSLPRLGSPFPFSSYRCF